MHCKKELVKYKSECAGLSEALSSAKEGTDSSVQELVVLKKELCTVNSEKEALNERINNLQLEINQLTTTTEEKNQVIKEFQEKICALEKNVQEISESKENFPLKYKTYGRRITS